MKLLLYSHYFAPSIGGVETIVMSLACGLADLRTKNGAREFDVKLVTQTTRENFDDESLPFPVVRNPGFRQLINLVRATDIVHIAGPSFMPMLLSWLARRPFAVEHHTYQAICPNGLLIHQPERSVCPGHFQSGDYRECLKCRAIEVSKVRSLMSVLSGFPRRALVRRAAANIAVTEHVNRRLAMPQTTVVLHGIEPETNAANNPAAASHGLNTISFAFVGRFVPEKGLTVFIDALARLQKQGLQFEAVLIGDGPERARISSQIAAAGLEARVKMTGYLSGAALAAKLADVSVVVMPSLWEETAGLAAIEQMMRGRLVVCSDIGGLGEIVGDTGLKFPAGDAIAMAEALRRAIENPSLVEAKGLKARGRAAELFSRSQMIENHAMLYRKLTGEENAGS